MSDNIQIMKAKDLQQVKMGQTVMKILVQIAIYAFLGIMALIVLFPFYWMIISSLKDLDEYMRTVPTLFPEVVHFDNYARAIETAELGKLFMNTLYVGLASTLLSLVIGVCIRKT